MPRIAEGRAAAAPGSARQKDRCARMLRAAARLGAERGLERVQMQDVAREAGVAVATLYRYFPSKTHLFTSVMASQIDSLAARVRPPLPGEDPVDRLVELLAGATRDLLARPLLARAILQSNNAAHAGVVPVAAQNAAFTGDIMLGTLGICDPTPDDLVLVRLVLHCWYGSLTEAVNGLLSVDEAVRDVHVSARILLGERCRRAPRLPTQPTAAGLSR